MSGWRVSIIFLAWSIISSGSMFHSQHCHCYYFLIGAGTTATQHVNKTRHRGAILTTGFFFSQINQQCLLMFFSKSSQICPFYSCYHYLVRCLIIAITWCSCLHFGFHLSVLWHCCSSLVTTLSKVCQRFLVCPGQKSPSCLTRSTKPFFGLASTYLCIHSSYHFLPWILCFSITRILVVSTVS